MIPDLFNDADDMLVLFFGTLHDIAQTILLRPHYFQTGLPKLVLIVIS